jgi:putative transposase
VHEYIVSVHAPEPTRDFQCKELTQARKNNPQLKAVHSQVLQQVLNQLHKAFKSMRERGHGFPRFKKRGRMRSFLFPQFKGNHIEGSRINLPRLKWVNMHLSRPIPKGANIKQVRIVKRASGWYAMLLLEVGFNFPEQKPCGKPIGIDMGINHFIATSEGEFIENPRYTEKVRHKLKLLQQRASRKVKGSKNWHKVQQKIASLYEHVANARKDFHFKKAHKLCNQAGMLFAEDLNIKPLCRGNSRKSILDAGWGQFLYILSWVCRKRGVFFLQVDPRNTSQTCPQCLAHTGRKKRNQRSHECSHCGYRDDRDVAAAKVIKHRGLTAVGYTVELPVDSEAVPPSMKQEISRAI